MPEALSCDLCGKGIEDTPEDNCWHGEVPYPGDVDHTGMCRACGGDPTARTTREKLGRAMACFIDARIPIVRDALSPTNRALFEALSYEKKAETVTRMVAKGLIA